MPVCLAVAMKYTLLAVRCSMCRALPAKSAFDVYRMFAICNTGTVLQEDIVTESLRMRSKYSSEQLL